MLKCDTGQTGVQTKSKKKKGRVSLVRNYTNGLRITWEPDKISGKYVPNERKEPGE